MGGDGEGKWPMRVRAVEWTGGNKELPKTRNRVVDGNSSVLHSTKYRRKSGEFSFRYENTGRGGEDKGRTRVFGGRIETTEVVMWQRDLEDYDRIHRILYMQPYLH
jgi:hypothetical protein